MNNQVNTSASGALQNAMPSAPTSDDKISFTPEQQERIDEIIKASMGRAGKEARAEATELRRQLDALSVNPDTRTASLEAQLKDSDAALAQLRSEAEVTQAMRIVERTALQAGFQHVEDIGTLLAGRIKIVNGNPTVLTDRGTTRYNGFAMPMSVEEYIEDFAKTRSYYLPKDRSVADLDINVQTSDKFKYPLDEIFGRTSNSRKASALKRSDPQMYASMKVQARELGLID